MWHASMHTEHFEFEAIGRTQAAAKRRLVSAFAIHLEEYNSSLSKWKQSVDSSSVEDYYGINTKELVSDGMWRDGERLMPREIKKNDR